MDFLILSFRIWLIFQRIQLTSEAFDLDYSPNCTDDYLAITVRGVTQKFCGNSQPPLGIYTGNITLHFHSDWAKERTGFSIRYERLNSTGKKKTKFSNQIRETLWTQVRKNELLYLVRETQLKYLAESWPSEMQ